MATLIFAASANPAVDRPLLSVSRARLEMLLATGAVQIISAPGCRHAAQYLNERRSYAPPSTPAEIKPFNYANTGGPRPWAKLKSGHGIEVMQQTDFFVMSRHFTQTRNGLNFAPNETTSPRDHEDPGAHALVSEGLGQLNP